MPNTEQKKNEFEKQIQDIDEQQKNSANPGYYIGSGKIPHALGVIRKYPIILIILGSLGLVFSGLSLLNIYKGANKVGELVMPIIYNFIPFTVSFLLLRLGMKEFNKIKK
jgi:hypothetical protein